MTVEVYDIECFRNCFIYTGYNTKTEEIYQYVLHDSRNDLVQFIYHLTSHVKMMVGFNNENYAYPLLHYIISNYHKFERDNINFVLNNIFNESQKILSNANNIIFDKDKYIKQCDLFSIWHFKNPARKTSLMDFAFANNMPSISTHNFNTYDYIQLDGINTLLEYNTKKVEIIYNLLLITRGFTDNPLYADYDKIMLRENLRKKYRINFLNNPDVKIGEKLILYLYSRATNKSIIDVKKLRTERETINLKECIPEWCDISNKSFMRFVESIKNTTINVNNPAFNYKVFFNNISLQFALGGAHGCVSPCVITPKEDEMIVDIDVNSLYPSIICSLGLHPQHLGIEFSQIIQTVLDDRLKEKAKENKDEGFIKATKLILNGLYGKSNDKDSFLYDPLMTYKTTIAGQILMCMWLERLNDKLSYFKPLMVNSDGISCIIYKSEYDTLKCVCEDITNIVGVTFDFNTYKKMVIKDVNNYIAEYIDSTEDNEHLKLKGCFEINKEIYKDSSMKIVPIALKNLFINNIPIEDTIKNHKNIYDFCIRLKVTNGNKAEYHKVIDDEIVKQSLPKTVRYYASTKGGGLATVSANGIKRVLSGYKISLFNEYEEKDEYNIDYSFYIAEANKIYYTILENENILF